MNSLIPLELNNQRVMTTKTLAEAFGTEEKNIQTNFLRNVDRFIEGKHYYKLEGDELKQFKASLPTESREPLKFVSQLILWTERGAARHAKILDTDEAWEVYERLEETYFKVKEINPFKALSKELQAIFILDKKQQELENRVLNLEDNMTIDYGQQLTLQDIAKKRAIEVMGGTDSPTYKNSSIRGKVFSQIWKDYKDYFQINSYRNTPKKDFERAKEYLNNWQAQGKILREIEDCNNQMQIDKEAI